MLRPIAAAAAVLVIAGSSFVYAQQHNAGPGGASGEAGQGYEHRQQSTEDMAAFADARIAALKAGLELTPEQAKNWPPLERALRDLAELRIQEKEAREAARAKMQEGQTASTPFDRLARKADVMAKKGDVLKRVAAAGAPLYESFTDSQKRRFMELAQLLRPHHADMHACKRGREGGAPDGAMHNPTNNVEPHSEL